jgi:alpha-L-arabinofuranosidase
MNFLVIRKSGFWVIFVMLTAMQLSAQVKLSIDLNNTGARISPVHYGVFFEDINLAADGGLYAELIKNRSFEDYESTDPWIITNYSGAVSSMSVDTANLLNSAQRKALKLAISSLPYENSLTRLINKGYWGLKINKNETYKVSFFARCDTSFKGDISVSLENIYSQQYAKTIITGIGQEWKKFTCELQPYNDLDEFVQEALDAIEYANGDSTTKYGAMRAAAGHPEPFNLTYLEIGNENYYGDHYGERYIQFYNAIKSKYPDIICIGNVANWGTDSPLWTFDSPVDLIDEHYYRNPQWFINQYHKYDSYDRNGPKVYVGEYAVTEGCGQGNLAAAIGEAVYMCGMEKNSDIVPMNSYAPLFVNINHRSWNPDLINFNSSEVYCTPSYYVQKLFAGNIGTVNLNVIDSLNTWAGTITGAVGVGSWSTTVEYDDVKVEDADGTILINESFNDLSNWATVSGTWTATSGTYTQSSMETDCRSVTKSSISDTSYTYSLRARKTGSNEGFLIIFGYKNSNDFYWWNLGGWGNTKHAVEKAVSGAKTVVSEVSGSIETGVWYNIKINVTASKVFCYLNDVLVQSFAISTKSLLYTSASLDEQDELVYLKIVNPSESDIETSFIFNGLSNDSLQMELTTLSSGSLLDENSFASPQNVFPVIQPAQKYADEFTQTLKAYSVNIIKVKADEKIPVSKVKKNDYKKFSVSPNPASGQITFRFDSHESYPVQVQNSLGIVILNCMAKDGSIIDCSKWNPGMYLIHSENLGTHKIIVC